MDDKRVSSLASTPASHRSSALPRPASRLPLSRASGMPASGGVRPEASRENLRMIGMDSTSQITTNKGNSQGVDLRLRSRISRERVGAPTLPKPQRLNGPPVSSQAALGSAAGSGDPPRDNALAQSSSTHGPRRISSFQHLRKGTLQTNSAAPQEERDLSSLYQAPNIHAAGDEITIENARSRLRPSRSRLSLAERTAETLAQLPSSPALKRRGSNFFESDSSRRPSSRSGSAGSRPSSSHQSEGPNRQGARSGSRPSYRPAPGPDDDEVACSNAGEPSNTRVQSSGSISSTPFKQSPSTVKTRAYRNSIAYSPLSASRKLQSAATPSATTSKTGSARSLKGRPSRDGLSNRSSASHLDHGASDLVIRPTRKVATASGRSSTASGDRNLSSASTTSTSLTIDSAEEVANPAFRRSSAALREQIARAKAAKRAAPGKASGAIPTEAQRSPVVPTDYTFDFGLSDDPFGQGKLEDANRQVLGTRVSQARTTGRLNVAAMGLKQIPEEVLKMYDFDAESGKGGAWAESVDLTRFIAADNELETLDDAIFPDADPVDLADDEDGQGSQFGGLESLDLHGNMLIELPLGLRRLQMLTSLNLAQNKLANNCLDIISQVTSLRDLKLGNNLLYGALDSCLVKLDNLEMLDLRGNNITSLPDGLHHLSRLRVLNLSENALETLPFTALANVPITELLANKNKLRGTLIDRDVEALPHLQTLDVSSNQLTLVAPVDGPTTLLMPSLHQLTLSLNRIQALPNMSTWKSLLTLTADENSITAFPEGFMELENLRNADFTSNDIRVVPPEIARMDGLSLLRITGNPLRDKKLASLTTDELKTALASRLEPVAGEDDQGIERFGNGFEPAGGHLATSSRSARHIGDVHVVDDLDESRSDYDDFATPPTSAPQSPARSRSHTLSSQTWPIKPGGILDRSNTKSSSLHPVICSKIAIGETVREIRLQHNTFTGLPNSLSFFADTLATLSMSHNQLVGESFMSEEIDLTALRELNLSQNHITSLAPLATHLRAPNLEKLDVSCNRIVSLPVLRDFFPSLTVLLVADNHLEDLDANAIHGMKIVAANNNDIAHLNPRIGLLGGKGGLERLEVSGNRFRVPRWNILERGTEATLRWLRGRVPVAEMAEWRASASNDEEDGAFGDLD